MKTTPPRLSGNRDVAEANGSSPPWNTHTVSHAGSGPLREPCPSVNNDAWPIACFERDLALSGCRVVSPRGLWEDPRR